MTKKIFTQELEGTRTGRPKKRWKEEVERDLQVLGVRRWRQLVTDRKKWKDIVRQAKAHSGLYCQWKKEEEEEGRRCNFMFRRHKICFVLMTHDRDLHKIGATFYI